MARLESLKQELSRQLAGVLAWETLVPVEVRIQSLLFSVEVDVLGKELVDFLPFSVLAESDDRPGLLALCDAPSETCQVVLFMESAVHLSQGHHVPLIPWAEYDMIFERRYRNVPEIEFLRHKLKQLGRQTDLRLKGSNRFQHGAGKGRRGLEKLLQRLTVLDGTQEHLVDALRQVLLLLARENRPELAEKLRKEDVCKRFVVMVGGVDADHLRERVQEI